MFILNRTHDWADEPKKKILLRSVIWFIAMIIISSVIIGVCQGIYKAMGIDPSQLTKFGGDINTHLDKPLGQTILFLLVIAPVVEEIIFRLGLSFRRQTVALWLALLPIAIAAYIFKCYNWMALTALVLLGVALYWLIVRYTTDEQWAAWRTRYLRLAMWLSSIGFALIHLHAFSVITWALLPYCLAFILRPGLVGCVFTYARVNLGFWWGVLFHVLNNVPGVLMLLAMSTQ
jgi:hypothetical protein